MVKIKNVDNLSRLKEKFNNGKIDQSAVKTKFVGKTKAPMEKIIPQQATIIPKKLCHTLAILLCL